MNRLIQAYVPKKLLAHTIEERNEAGVPKLRLLPGQKLKTLSGEEEDADINTAIQCESAMREKNPVGTVFEIYITEKRSGIYGEPTAPYYTSAGYAKLKLKVHKP